jgi:predicted DNA-binding transcriptional regulator
MAPVELGILWAIPDMPLFKYYTDKRWKARRADREREYYLDQLWGLEEREALGFSGWLKALMFEAEDDLDERVVRRHSPEFQHYIEMRDIVEKLREMVDVAGVRISVAEIGRFEVVINGYLRLLIACKPLAKALQATNKSALQRELKELEKKLKHADRIVAPVFRERHKLLSDQVDRIPKLKATLELMRTRAEAVVYQLRNIHSHVLTDPGTDVNEVLDDMLQRQQAMIDPLGDLAADQMVDDFLNRPDTRAFLDRAEDELERETHAQLEPVQLGRAARARQKQGN